jgi:hypothetical protein
MQGLGLFPVVVRYITVQWLYIAQQDPLTTCCGFQVLCRSYAVRRTATSLRSD